MNPRIEAKVIGEYGVEQAMFGMGLSFGVCSGMNFDDFGNNRVDVQERMMKVFENNATKDGGHNKFLESMQIWLDVNAPRFWWSEADTYRVGSTKQSESTMHTLVKQIKNMKFRYDEISNLMVCDELDKYIEDQFDYSIIGKKTIAKILEDIHFGVNSDTMSDAEKLVLAKGLLPEAFMQRRIWNINYKTLRNIYLQRNGHRLPHWNVFLEQVIEQLKHPEFIKMEMKMFGNLKLGGE
jgi:hypothetical protein|nr:MAG TPA: THYMIDYLATE SYNTHASE [Caudoviricetes sp.]